MDGVCIKIGLIFPVALQEAIKNLKLRRWLLVQYGLAGLYFQSSLNKREERKREQHLKSFPTAIALLLAPSLLPSLLLRRITKGGGQGRAPREIRSFKRGAKAVAFNGEGDWEIYRQEMKAFDAGL